MVEVIYMECDTPRVVGVLRDVKANTMDGAIPVETPWRGAQPAGHTPRTSLMTDTRPGTSIDPTLPLRAKAGDRQAFAQLVDVMYPRSLRFALHMVGNREDAEEAVQDAFVRVYHNLGRFRGLPQRGAHALDQTIRTFIHRVSPRKGARATHRTPV